MKDVWSVMQSKYLCVTQSSVSYLKGFLKSFNVKMSQTETTFFKTDINSTIFLQHSPFQIFLRSKVLKSVQT